MGVAYAEAASLVDFLVQQHGEGAIAGVLRALRQGADFPSALRRVTGLTPEQFEAGLGEGAATAGGSRFRT